MEGSLTLELWKVGLGAVVVVFGIAGLVLSVLRWQLGALVRGQRTLFARVNLYGDRITQLEKFALLVAPERSAMFTVVPPRDFDTTVILEPRQ